MSDAWPQIVQDLLRREAYGLTSGKVTLRTTHASWVFLTDGDVWKLKRPVDLGFLDFRDGESRRRACEDEVRLNRRLAPDIYLGVVPVHRTSRGHLLRQVGEGDGPGGGSDAGSDAGSDDGPIVDWAVHMRRLPDAASADGLLAQGRLDQKALSTVAERLASFLGAARPTPEFGDVAALGRNLDENFDQVAPFVGELLDQETFDEVQAFQRGELTRNATRFAARVAEGRVREGHGDLRLEHLYLLPAKEGPPQPVIIDCIEFAERFRCGDTAAELAFLSMELESEDRPDLAAGLVARFVEASDDFGLYGVLDFYLSYRAWVRGKVAAFLAVDPSTPLALSASKREEARHFFGLSRAFSGTPLDRPFLIAVGGPIGSGKSTLAAELGRELAVPVVSSDRTRKVSAGLPLTAPADGHLYEKGERDRTYDQVIRRATEVIQAGRGVVIDATFSTRRWRQLAAEAAHAAQASFVFVETHCRPELLRDRLAERRGKPSVSDANEQLLESFLRDYEPLTPLDPQPCFAVETDRSPEIATRAAMRQLATTGILAAAARRAS
jgi:uncharacterized protein